MALPENRPISEIVVASQQMADISAPSTVFAAATHRGRLVRFYAVLSAAITVANSNVTVTINGVAVTGLSLVAAFTGSAPGSVFVSTVASGLNYVNEGDSIGFISDGGSTTTSIATFYAVIERD